MVFESYNNYSNVIQNVVLTDTIENLTKRKMRKYTSSPEFLRNPSWSSGKHPATKVRQRRDQTALENRKENT